MKLDFIAFLESLQSFIPPTEKYLLSVIIKRFQQIKTDNSLVFRLLEDYNLAPNRGDLGIYLCDLTNEEREQIIQGILDPKYPYFFEIPDNFKGLIYQSSWQVPTWRWAIIEYLARLNLVQESTHEF